MRGRKREWDDGADVGGGGGNGGIVSMDVCERGAVFGPGDVDGRRGGLGVIVALDEEGGMRPELERVRTAGRRSRISATGGGGFDDSFVTACVSSGIDGMDDCD